MYNYVMYKLMIGRYDPFVWVARLQFLVPIDIRIAAQIRGFFLAYSRGQERSDLNEEER